MSQGKDMDNHGSGGADYEREDLTKSFIEAIVKGKDPGRFFDEDDLIEIFDYASDIPDDCTRLEVLLYAGRVFPDSNAMMERRGWFYSEMGIPDGARMVVERLPRDSVMRRLIEISSANAAKEDTEKALAEIVASTPDFEDEWMIRLVDTASDLGCFDWLKANYDEIKRHTTYPQTLIYEMTECAEMAGDYPFAVSLAEELTMLEPYNCEFWEMLAELRINHLEDYAHALNDLDYALAINPDSTKSLILKGRALFELDTPMDEVIECYTRAKELDPDSPTAVHSLALTLLSRGYDLEALNTLDDYRITHPGDVATIEYMLLASKGNVNSAIIEEAVSSSGTSALEECAQRLAAEKEHRGAMLIYDVLAAGGAVSEADFHLELLYRNHRYQEAIELSEKMSAEGTHTPVADLVWALSMVRLGKKEGLKDKISDMLEMYADQGEPETFQQRIARFGCIVPLTSIHYSLVNNSAVNADDVDPFV